MEKLRAMEEVRHQSDKERHLLRMDREKECGRLTELSDQLRTENQGLRREIESLKQRLAEVQQESALEQGSTVSEEDGGQLVSHVSNHSLDAAHSLHVGSQPVEEGGVSVPNPQPVASAEEQTASTPIMSHEQLLSGSTDGKSTNESTTSVVSVEGSSCNPTSPSMIQQVTQLLQAQRDMMAVQIEAIATNSVPPLNPLHANFRLRAVLLVAK